jgi:UbiA prenyltransferase family.
MESGSFKATMSMLGPIAWLALAAGLQMLGALLFFRAPVDWILITTYFFITFGVYLLNRFTDTEDSFNCPEQRMFFQQKSKLIFIPISFIVASVILLTATNRLVFWHIVLIVLGVLYSVSLIPIIHNKSIRFARLKDILFLKNIAVSLLWGITPFAIAASQKSPVLSTKGDLVIVVMAFCLTTLINTVSCDVRDTDGDRHAGVLTLATRFGEKRTGLFLFVLGLLISVIVIIDFLLGNVGKLALILFMSTVAWTGVVAMPIYMKKIKLPKSLSEPLIDTQQIVCGISLIALSISI